MKYQQALITATEALSDLEDVVPHPGNDDLYKAVCDLRTRLLNALDEQEAFDRRAKEEEL